MPKRKPRSPTKKVYLYIGRCYRTHKRQYRTEADARAEAKQYRKRVGPRLKPYQCIYCHFWHNGHDRPPARRGPRAMDQRELRYNKNRQSPRTPAVARERAATPPERG